LAVVFGLFLSNGLLPVAVKPKNMLTTGWGIVRAKIFGFHTPNGVKSLVLEYLAHTYIHKY